MNGNQDIGQMYLNWLYSMLLQAFQAGDREKLGNPDEAGGVGVKRPGWPPWGQNIAPSPAYQLMQQAQQLVAAGQIESLPYVDQFYDIIRGRKLAFPEQAVAGDWIAPGLIRTPEGDYVDEQGRPVSSGMAQKILSDYYAQAEAAGLTPYQAGQLQLGWAELAQRQREAQQAMLEQYTAPRDWIKRWYMMNMPQPRFAAPERGVPFWEGLPPEMRGAIMTLGEPAQMVGPTGYPQPVQYQQALGDVMPDLSRYPVTGVYDPNVARQMYNEFFGVRGEGEMPSIPSAPPTPAWLPQFVPGLTAGQPITAQEIKTPSGQLWSATPWSVQQGLAGYADWAGYRPIEDIMAHMEMMRPQTPYTYGGWRPAMARA